MTQIITVKIEDMKKHPEANKLQICQVSDGNQSYQVVCGAKNAKKGMVTVLAKVESTLPSGKKIQAASLRNVESKGMLCSPNDLDIRSESGIITLPANTLLGKNINELKSYQLSSTPWFDYKWVECQVLEKENIKIISEKDHLQSEDQVISETYWDGKNYLYRSL